MDSPSRAVQSLTVADCIWTFGDNADPVLPGQRVTLIRVGPFFYVTPICDRSATATAYHCLGG
jgi:hypothetical protein